MRAITSRHRADSERGSAALEAAIVLGLLLLLVLGSFEWGMALRDWITVSSSSREGARAASSAGNIANADCRILEAAAGALQNLPSDAIVEIQIYRSDDSGGVGPMQVYRPRADSDTEPVALTCSRAWFRARNNYPAANRQELQWIGVNVVFDHEWRTDFLWFNGTVRWAEETVMRIEPDVS